MRLIDADALKAAIHDDWDEVCVWDASGEDTAYEFVQLVDEQPTIEPERKKGKWVYPYGTTQMVSICSICGTHARGNFCPNCGAQMERGEG